MDKVNVNGAIVTAEAAEVIKNLQDNDDVRDMYLNALDRISDFLLIDGEAESPFALDVLRVVAMLKRDIKVLASADAPEETD